MLYPPELVLVGDGMLDVWSGSQVVVGWVLVLVQVLEVLLLVGRTGSVVEFWAGAGVVMSLQKVHCC